MSVIIDTDPGVDDMLALLLLMASDEIHFKMISLTFGNCSLNDTLNNILSLMKVVDIENKWRKSTGLKPFSSQRPAIYIGSNEALKSSNTELSEDFNTISLKNESPVDATHVHGNDGLAGVHEMAPEFDAPSEWFEYFTESNSTFNTDELPFIPGGMKPSWLAIIETLKNEPENTVSILSIGPLTNIAKAAQYDPVAFSRVKQVVSMGGVLRTAGNVTPLAEFNVFADPIAAAKVYALTSKNQVSMLPPGQPEIKLPKELELILFPLDITHKHFLFKKDVEAALELHRRNNPDSKLLEWVTKWMLESFSNYGKLIGKGPEHGMLNLHDPLTVAYVLNFGSWETQTEDVRVETSGQWSLGATIVDDRGRVKAEANSHDPQKWLTIGEGNRIKVVSKSPVESSFQSILLEKIMNFQ